MKTVKIFRENYTQVDDFFIDASMWNKEKIYIFKNNMSVYRIEK